MKAKEIEKLLRRYVPAKTLLGSNREKLKAELQELHQRGIIENSKCTCEIPSTRMKCSENGIYGYCANCGVEL